MALTLAGCASGEELSPAPLAAGRVSASIAVLASGEVAVVNPDNGSVSFLDPESLDEIGRVGVGGEPHQLVELSSGALLVTTYRGGEVVWIDPPARAVVQRMDGCPGAFGLAAAKDESYLALSCAWEGTVRRLDPALRSAPVMALGLARPRGLAVVTESAGDRVIVAEHTGGHVVTIGDGALTRTSLVPEDAPYRPAIEGMTANLAAGVFPAFGAIYVPHELVNHTGDTTSEEVADDYGSVLDNNPKINPALTALAAGAAGPLGGLPVLYARFDGGARVYSGPSAAAPFGVRHLLVTHLSTRNVAVVDAFATDPDARAIGTYRAGDGPSGVAVDARERFAFVDNALDGSVSKIDLLTAFGPPAIEHEAVLTRARSVPSPYSAAAVEGRRIFHDATNPHLTPAGVVACSTCHPDGGDDGLVWFIRTPSIPQKRRRTPHLANARTGTAPFHWDGALPTIPDLVLATITGLMAGDALLIDRDAVRAYLDEIVLAPSKPFDPEAAARGKALFEGAASGCSACHYGPDLTDRSLHAVLSPMSLDPKDVIEAVDTPALHALSLRAPYFHDGRSPDLRDLLTRGDLAGHGDAGALTAEEQRDLIAYLESL